ncbi:MAG TPA: histidinol dehydrogenase [Microbacterium sp.]|uniref:histidinol dehydrogenase n=1 Tax=Microbacterium sp. TaxID=51671 RepID=UPI002C18D3FC|nr:histidinol dehydrogenase [Microbacterium sp.]HWI30221.1 histidinol dehydrogenase [Microbacterium sp.]
MRSRWLSRAGTWLLAFIVGGVYSLAGTIAHAYRLGWFPLGLVLAVIGSLALLVAVRALTADRWATLATGIGMLTTLTVISGRGPGGSVIVPQEGYGVAWTISLALCVLVVVAWPDLSQIPRRAPAAGAAAPHHEP